MKHEIIFSYLNERCHAVIVETLGEEYTRYVGELDGYEIYTTEDIIFNQFNFQAIRRA